MAFKLVALLVMFTACVAFATDTTELEAGTESQMIRALQVENEALKSDIDALRARDCAVQKVGAGARTLLGSGEGSRDEASGRRRKGWDWTKCKSEGGKRDCAMCSDAVNKAGMLPCNTVTGGAPISQCPDHNMAANRKYWYQNGSTGKGMCTGFAKVAALTGTSVTSWKFPGAAFGAESLVLTKAFVTHPHKASRKVGIFMFKRLVTHKCTGLTDACKKGSTVADVNKLGLCVMCETDIFPSTSTAHTTNEHRTRFVNTCLPKAVDPVTGKVNVGFRCTGDDQKYAQASIAGF